MTNPPSGPYGPNPQDPYNQDPNQWSNPYGTNPGQPAPNDPYSGQQQGFPQPGEYPQPGQQYPPTGPTPGYSQPYGTDPYATPDQSGQFAANPYGADAYGQSAAGFAAGQPQPMYGGGPGGPGGPPPGKNPKRAWFIGGGIGGALIAIIVVVVLVVVFTGDDSSSSSSASSSTTEETTSTPPTDSPQNATDCTDNVSGGSAPSGDTVTAGALSFPKSTIPDWRMVSDTDTPNAIGMVGGMKSVTPKWAMNAEIGTSNLVSTLSIAEQASKLLTCIAAGPGYNTSTPTLGAIKTSTVTVDGTQAARAEADITVGAADRGVSGDSVIIIVVQTNPATFFFGASPIGDAPNRTVIERVIAALKVAKV